MKKCSLMLVALLSLASAHNAFGCIGWADGLVAKLQNKHGYCSDLPTEYDQAVCYAFKKEFAQFLAADMAALERVKRLELVNELTNDGQLILNSASFLFPHFENMKALIAALRVRNEDAQTAEQVLAEIAVSLANNSEDKSFGRLDIGFIYQTQAGIAAPKCR